MKWPSLKTTQVRMALFIGALVLAAALTAMISVVSAAAQQVQIAQMRDYTSMLEEHSNARVSLLKEQLAVKNTFLATSDRAQDYGSIQRYSDQFDDFLYYQQLRSGKQDTVETLIQSNDQLHTQLEKFFSLLLFPGNNDLALAQMNLEQIDPQAAKIDGQIQDLANQQQQQMRVLLDSMEASSRYTMLIGQVALALLAVLIVWGIYTIMNITSPLDSLTSAIVAFENRAYSPDLLARDVQRPDELGLLARSVGGMAESITASNALKEKFLQAAQRFIPVQYLDFLGKDDITNVRLGDHVSAEMAVMFSDIRGFTSISEKMSAKENFDFVNEYLKLVSPIVQKHEGFIVKFLGDGMMAIFPYGVDDAVQAGIEKGLVVQQFNQSLQERGLPPISVGIGVHTGPMMVGMIGEELRMQGDAFSDNVNLTSRIEGLNKFYGTSMIISEETLQQLPATVQFKMRYLGKTVVKGREHPLSLFEVYDGLPPATRALRDAIRADFEQGVKLYSEACFAQAAGLFQQVLARDPADRAARFYLDSCADLVGRARPEHWNGAIIMDAK